MSNVRLHNCSSLINHNCLLEHSICGSKGLYTELLRDIPSLDYPTSKLQDCLLALEPLLDEAIACIRQSGEILRAYAKTLNSD